LDTDCNPGLGPRTSVGELFDVDPARGMANVNADCLRRTFSSCSRLRMDRRFSFSTVELNDLFSSSATFASSYDISLSPNFENDKRTSVTRASLRSRNAF
jgi:hypothetical protein